MARISFTENLRRHIDCPPMTVEGSAVGEVLQAVFADNPRLRSYLLDDQGRVRKHVNVYVNDRLVADRVRLSDPVTPSDHIFVFQALSGG